MGAKVQVVEREGGGGTITIDCFSEEELHGLIELLERIGTTVPSDPVRGNSTPFSV